MATKIFVNLPVKDLQKSIEFYMKLGYTVADARKIQIVHDERNLRHDEIHRSFDLPLMRKPRASG